MKNIIQGNRSVCEISGQIFRIKLVPQLPKLVRIEDSISFLKWVSD
jgi:hypothetical protein